MVLHRALFVDVHKFEVSKIFDFVSFYQLFYFIYFYFSNQKGIKLIKSDSKDIYNVTKVKKKYIYYFAIFSG